MLRAERRNHRAPKADWPLSPQAKYAKINCMAGCVIRLWIKVKSKSKLGKTRATATEVR